MSNQSTPRSLKAICAARHLRTAELDLQDVAQHFSAASAFVLDNKLADRLACLSRSAILAAESVSQIGRDLRKTRR